MQPVVGFHVESVQLMCELIEAMGYRFLVVMIEGFSEAKDSTVDAVPATPEAVADADAASAGDEGN